MKIRCIQSSFIRYTSPVSNLILRQRRPNLEFGVGAVFVKTK